MNAPTYGHHSVPSWGSNGANDSHELFPGDNSFGNLFNNGGVYPSSSIEAPFFGAGNGSGSIGGFDQLNGMGPLLHPSTPLDNPGLPFPGLEFIRNYNQAGGSGSSGFAPSMDQDSLWHSYDPGAFGLDPESAFTLGNGFNVGDMQAEGGSKSGTTGR
jgi:hypothetical protein